MIGRRNRDLVTSDTVDTLIALISKAVEEYQSSHSGLLSSIFPGENAGLLQAFSVELKKLKQDREAVHPFVTYAKLINGLADICRKLKQESGSSLVMDLRGLLIDELKQQVEADWNQENIEPRQRTDVINERLNYALRSLNEAAEYESQAHLLFTKKFSLYGKERPGKEDLPLWNILLEEETYSGMRDKAYYINQIDQDTIGVIIADLKSAIGIKSQSVMSDHHVTQDKSEETEKGYFKNIVDQIDKDVSKLEEKFKCGPQYLIEEPIPTLVKHLHDYERTGYTVSIVQQLLREALGRQPERGKQKEKLADYPKLVDELLKLEDILDIKITRDNRDSLKLESWQEKILKQVVDQLHEKIRIKRLRTLINHVKNFPGKSEYREELMAAVRADRHDYFSSRTHDEVHKLQQQIEVFSVKNLLVLCLDYMRHYVRLFESSLRSGLELSSNPMLQKELKAVYKMLPPHEMLEQVVIKRFLMPMIDDVINPTLSLLGKSSISVSKYELEMLRDQVLKLQEMPIHKQPGEVERDTSASPVTSLDRRPATHTPKESNELLDLDASSMKLRDTVLSIVPDANYDPLKINQSQALRQALIAACSYYLAESGMHHGSHGKEATILFINRLLALKDTSVEKIQREALKFIQGKGEYGAWYGGASGFHRHSRVGFLLDSGLFDNKRDLIMLSLSTTISFFGQRSFADLPNEERKDLTQTVKSMNSDSPVTPCKL